MVPFTHLKTRNTKHETRNSKRETLQTSQTFQTLKTMPNLFLIPTSLGECDFNRILPSLNTEIVTDLRYFIVEDLRTARRFLKKANPAIDIDQLTFFVLNQHTTPEELSDFLKPMFDGNDMGVLSEAGCLL